MRFYKFQSKDDKGIVLCPKGFLSPVKLYLELVFIAFSEGKTVKIKLQKITEEEYDAIFKEKVNNAVVL